MKKILTKLLESYINATIRLLIESQAEQRETLRHFRIEITDGVFGRTIKLIQRETPLTDEQLNKLL
jgi:hypothetical protein